jgi:hypothetical protein
LEVFVLFGTAFFKSDIFILFASLAPSFLEDVFPKVIYFPEMIAAFLKTFGSRNNKSKAGSAHFLPLFFILF